ncbi:MAG: hypothetical protein KDK36_02240, partial [Leptospiraceae bacterium]|nr:hypothetical protein [Leptospiraceae bacterium]
MYKLFFQLIILFSFGGLSAETVILKSGKEVDGKVIHRDETKILIVEKGNGNTVTYYSKEEVKSIKVGDPTPTPTKTENSLPLRTKFFGTLKTDITYSDNAVLSYDIESHQSANSAKRQVMARDNSARWGIMFNQTMLGYEVEYGEKIKGKILV